MLDNLPPLPMPMPPAILAPLDPLDLRDIESIPPPPFVVLTGRLFLRLDYPGDHCVIFEDISPSPSSPSQFHFMAGDRIRHELDPPGSRDLSIADLDGRLARVEMWGNRYRATILGGASIADRDARAEVEMAIIWELEEMVAAGMGAMDYRTPDDDLIERGFGSRRYGERRDAHAKVMRRGLSMVPALVRGARSVDPEVRVRGGAALDELRNGGGR